MGADPAGKGTLGTRVLQVLLMACGPFYFYPWKPLVQLAAGSSYDVGLEHFVAGHRSGVNLALHTLCLFVQVFGNFALLHVLDERYVPEVVPGVRTLSAATAGSWAALLLLTSGVSRLGYSLAATALLYGTYELAPAICAVPLADFDLAVAAGFVAVLVVSNILFRRVAVGKMVGGAVQAAGVIGALHALITYAGPSINSAAAANGLLDRMEYVHAAALAHLALLASQRNAIRPLVITGVFTTRLAFILTDDVVYFYLGYAFVASMLQGVTHSTVQEEATLYALERAGERAKLAFEYAHTCYFPCLVMDAVVASALGREPVHAKAN